MKCLLEPLSTAIFKGTWSGVQWLSATYELERKVNLMPFGGGHVSVIDQAEDVEICGP